ncbi:MAG: hypothetical protein ACOCTT_00610 [archaeon]
MKKKKEKNKNRPVKRAAEQFVKEEGIKRLPEPTQKKFKEIIEKATGREVKDIEKQIKETKKKIEKAIAEEEEIESVERTVGLTKEEMKAFAEVGKKLRESKKKK